ncbi:unnamed protein product [Musa acuminata var. zebrina]
MSTSFATNQWPQALRQPRTAPLTTALAGATPRWGTLPRPLVRATAGQAAQARAGPAASRARMVLCCCQRLLSVASLMGMEHGKKNKNKQVEGRRVRTREKR